MSKVRVEDEMTKEQFITCWCNTGLPPDDPYLRHIMGGFVREQAPVSESLRTVAVAEKMWQIRNDKIRLVPILRRPKRIAECLEEYNLWRRGADKYSTPGCDAPCSAYMLGKLIEGAIAHLRASDTEIVL